MCVIVKTIVFKCSSFFFHDVVLLFGGTLVAELYYFVALNIELF